jgi:hypothetical protein
MTWIQSNKEIFVRKQKKNTCKSRNEKLYCEKCGFKKHGKNHDLGEHHRIGVKGKADVSGY